MKGLGRMKNILGLLIAFSVANVRLALAFTQPAQCLTRSRTINENAQNTPLDAANNRDNLDLDALQKAAKDPKSFEEYVLNKKIVKEEAKIEEEKTASTKKGYVPIEQWDEERKKDSLQWEEKVQFEGQMHGNRFKQNEILRHNLNTF